MILKSELKHGKSIYMYNRDGLLKRCDLIKFGASPTKFGYMHEDTPWDLKPLLESDLEYFFKSREEAEQYDLFV